MTPDDQATAIERLRAEVAELRRAIDLLTPPPKARAITPPMGDAIGRVECTYVHSGKRTHLRTHVGRCVYLLLDGTRVTYVGRSRLGFGTRADSHDGKPGERVVIADLTIGDGVRAERAFESLEAHLVSLYSPPFNDAPLTGLLPVAELWPLHGGPLLSRIFAALP